MPYEVCTSNIISKIVPAMSYEVCTSNIISKYVITITYGRV